MATQKKVTKNNSPDPAKKHRTTSIGRGDNSRPTNKRARRNHKKYRGQGG